MKNVIRIVILMLFVSCAKETKEITISVTNPSNFDRSNEMVEFSKQKLQQFFQNSENESFVILNEAKEEVAYQVLSNNTTVIFPATVKAKATTTYTLKKGTPKKVTSLAYGKFVPERKDDFAWENNRVAFRMYGPALEATGEVSNGIDFWAKRTQKLVVDKWYADEFAEIKTYHTDGGEGLDFYKVGRSLGVGAAAPFIDEKLIFGNNFTSYKILENGPLRISFELEYAPFSIGKNNVKEKRIISLDAYSQLNKIEEVFESSEKEFPVAVGFVLRDEQDKKIVTSPEKSVIAYEEPLNEKHGTVYVGAIYPKKFTETKEAQGHFLGITTYKGNKITYYAGAGWSKFGFSSLKEWQDYLVTQNKKISNPLIISVK